MFICVQQERLPHYGSGTVSNLFCAGVIFREKEPWSVFGVFPVSAWMCQIKRFFGFHGFKGRAEDAREERSTHCPQ